MANVSGKLLIIGIVGVALAAAITSWWFRYTATNEAAQFWGSGYSRLIRDAPTVELYQFSPSGQSEPQFDELLQFLNAPTNKPDISSIKGLTHLRHALLEDRSYNWPPQPRRNDDRWRWVLVFRSSPTDSNAVIAFSPDWKVVTNCNNIVSGKNLSTEPIAAGLREMFGEIPSNTAQPAR